MIGIRGNENSGISKAFEGRQSGPIRILSSLAWLEVFGISKADSTIWKSLCCNSGIQGVISISLFIGEHFIKDLITFTEVRMVSSTGLSIFQVGIMESLK